jgi:hypothetical protein
MPPAARLLMIVGAALLALGLALWLVPGLRWLGHLPGDLRIERGGLRVFVPITSSLLLSAALTLLVWLVSRLR